MLLLYHAVSTGVLQCATLLCVEVQASEHCCGSMQVSMAFPMLGEVKSFQQSSNYVFAGFSMHHDRLVANNL